MRRFEYQVTIYPSEQFSRVAYFCSEQGDCRLDQIPSDQPKALEELLNERGSDGWEVVQMFFSPEGLLAVWKRLI